MQNTQKRDLIGRGENFGFFFSNKMPILANTGSCPHFIDQTLNQFHNILRLFDVLLIIPSTASETMCNYYLQTWNIRFASRIALRVAERLKTEDLRKLRNIRKLSKRHRVISQCQSPCEKESFVNTRRKLLKNRY